MNSVKKFIIVLVTIFLGGIAGIFFWFYSERTIWHRLEYFPYPVEDLIYLKPFGKEFWVEGLDGEIFKITYPCLENKDCWETSTDVPPVPNNGMYVDEDVHEYINYSKSNDGTCKSNSSLFPGILLSCISSTAGNESLYIFLLGLNDKNELWVWDQPWESPYNTIEKVQSSICLGSLAGLFMGLILIQIPLKGLIDKNSI
jgi:hypothetical protein